MAFSSLRLMFRYKRELDLMEYYYEKLKPNADIFLQHYIYNINFFRINWHKYFELLILLEGRTIVCVEGKKYALHKNDIFLINPNEMHTIIPDQVNSNALIIHFSSEVFKEAYPNHENLKIFCRSELSSQMLPKFQYIRLCAAVLVLSSLHNDLASKLMHKGSFEILLGLLLSKFPIEETKKNHKEHEVKNRKAIQEIIKYISKNFMKEISLDRLAKLTNYNRTYLSTFFRKNVGISFYEYLTRTRFRYALFLLNNTQKTVSEIALDSGFPDLKSFTTYYKRTLGMLPSEHPRSTITDNIQNYLFTDYTRNYLNTNDKNIKKILESFFKTNSKTEIENTVIKHKLKKKQNEMDAIKKLGIQILNICDSADKNQ